MITRGTSIHGSPGKSYYEWMRTGVPPFRTTSMSHVSNECWRVRIYLFCIDVATFGPASWMKTSTCWCDHADRSIVRLRFLRRHGLVWKYSTPNSYVIAKNDRHVHWHCHKLGFNPYGWDKATCAVVKTFCMFPSKEIVIHHFHSPNSVATLKGFLRWVLRPGV